LAPSDSRGRPLDQPAASSTGGYCGTRT
jgi:hypothetical protein